MQARKPKSRALLGQLTDMDLRLLRVFRSVVQCGGMAAAELELNIGISTISRHVKDLETRLGLVLCRRGRAGFTLTPEGQTVYEETLRLLASVEAFRSRVDGIHDRMGGELHIAVFDKTATNPKARLGDAIGRFHDEAPDVALNLHVASINEVERGIIDGGYQVGIIPAHRSSGSLVYADLFDERMLLYCGKRHPLFDAPYGKLTWSQMRGYAFAGLGYHSPNMELSHRAKLTRSATASDQESIATLILSGRYLGFLPDHYAESFEAKGLMRPVAPQRFHYSCRFVSLLRRSPQPSRAALLFQDCLEVAHAAAPAKA
ncbi:LysR family transcriptional regulator [Burkholderia oklahomensis]|uniref:Bacterial regulatory helix-turn-helix, lysR family protein n=1 Tax=Burkholderia oklahomensis TaxID=342113 RepID=A0AAI8B9Z6_9BURK|nr:LysR family transcriptional regulator [Burkholderia oklahomensis]AIO68452.1 bacterial regulatory helix-turn-helix, lysR family protein [Burkholderia oklahomensis]AOI39683.1 LysR family transcriptional regulator [Burkholderia oklahomensis EO147]KUY67770.1 LysR family transcriptional regulator [Burkholderia oklahomensis EO147]QPS39962.1 LysR family transcriptional regulator [Burkholderia oklahomensis]